MESLCEAEYKLSGCKSLTDFISCPAFCHGVQRAYVGDDVSWGSHASISAAAVAAGELPALANLQFSLRNLRAREEAGSLPLFLHALPTSIPSCKHLELWGVGISSLHELDALCRGIASPLCTLESLHLDVQPKRLVGDALSSNVSILSLTIISALCPEDRWMPCSVNDLHVKLVGDDTLDVLHSVFSALADNSLALISMSLTGSYDVLKEIDASSFTQPIMLESEKLLGLLLFTNTTLTSVHLYDLVMPLEAFQMLFISLAQNAKLTSFSLIVYPCLPGEVVCKLFASLENNRHLASLDLSYNCGEDWPSASSVLDRLRINGILSDFSCDESPLDDELYEEENSDGVTWEALSAQLAINSKNMGQSKASEPGP
ncbi:hypothetical protein GOP47_0005621 [Adiantum capillus-veneris]|uniref:Uncharacterized protein n=1 Tax=Adiantum capillus-veneris TaxID=13818 RepID=A0A9D4V724_ADICA|nr:hypothetical protein GOP47_0005621 [Adiantum capillus-veneris]